MAEHTKEAMEKVIAQAIEMSKETGKGHSVVERDEKLYVVQLEAKNCQEAKVPWAWIVEYLDAPGTLAWVFTVN